MWVQLSQHGWPEAAVASLRYATNSGGAVPRPLVEALKLRLPRTELFLMYGLTEAFRSTYLPPADLDRKPGSCGKAIPGAEILAVKDDGSACEPGETGELVHRGPHVALGYWGQPETTQQRFRPPPAWSNPAPSEVAVWSGDLVRLDEEGYCYYVGRRDTLIKTSGYRVSPTEIEEVALASGVVAQAVALGVPAPPVGQDIVLVVAVRRRPEAGLDDLRQHLRRHLPSYMQPRRIVELDAMPINAHGKIDREALLNSIRKAAVQT
jgi:acyl-CoA synthetase (AMP-forming)/AMP-acid ligase II